jgi:acyl carrier protein
LEEKTMSVDQIRAKLAQVFQRVLGHTVELKDNQQPGDIDGWDSLSHVTLILATEREFKVKFKTSELANIASVGKLVDQIRTKQGGT